MILALAAVGPPCSPKQPVVLQEAAWVALVPLTRKEEKPFSLQVPPGWLVKSLGHCQLLKARAVVKTPHGPGMTRES